MHALGESSVREMEEVRVPGPSMLRVDGLPRRVMCYYDKDAEVAERVWTVRATGGYREGKTALEMAEEQDHAEVAALLQG